MRPNVSPNSPLPFEVAYMLRAMDVLLEARYNTGEREDGWSDWFEAHWAIPSWGKGWGTETVWEFRRAP